MKKIIISASYRENSTSERLAASLFPDAEILKLKNFDIGFCRGCGGCDSTGRCVIADDMPALLEKILQADCVILAFPIYFDGVPAQLKAVIDRAQQLYTVTWGAGKKVEKTKILHTVSSCGGDAQVVSEKSIKYFADCIGAKIGSAFCLDDTDGDTDFSRVKQIL